MNDNSNIATQTKSLIAQLPASEAPRILITGGPTCEDIDDVRFLTNRSTGSMGITLAASTLARGWQPLLILGPTHLAPPDKCPTLRTRSAQEMCDAVLAALPWCDALVMSAAVADYTPAEPHATKMKKQDGDLLLRLKRTPDILQTVASQPDRAGKKIIGFALESSIDLDAAKGKLTRKNMDGILVNSTQAFGNNSVTATFISRDGNTQTLGTTSKQAIATHILDYIQP